jgi:hypothetical protein
LQIALLLIVKGFSVENCSIGQAPIPLIFERQLFPNSVEQVGERPACSTEFTNTVEKVRRPNADIKTNCGK